MAGGKWVIFWALVSFVYSVPTFSETHGGGELQFGSVGRRCHQGRHHGYGGQGSLGTPTGAGYVVPTYGGFGTQFPSYQSYGTQFPSYQTYSNQLPGYGGYTGLSPNPYLVSTYNPYSNPYLGCSSYFPTSNYSGFPNYSFGYWSPSNGGYGVNYTQPGLYKSYQYGPYNYGYPTTLYSPYSSGGYPSGGTGYPGYSLTSGYPSYGTGYSLTPQNGYAFGYPGNGTGCQIVCAMRAGIY